MIYYMFSGQSLMVPNAPVSGLVKLKSKDGKFMGVGEVLEDGKIAPKRMIRV